MSDEQTLTGTDKFVNMTLLYLLSKAIEELKGLHSSEVLEKIVLEVEGVILNKERLLQGIEFLETAEVDVDLGAMGIMTGLPVCDRESPISYSIAQYVPWDLSVHRGAETCARLSVMDHGLERPIPGVLSRKKFLEAAF